jgi:anti-sigma-K factor RskA/putative zinc finger protein
MVAGQGAPSDDVRSGPEPHEEFLQLCALSTSGTLTEEEHKRLREHLTVCPACREAKKEFESVVDHGIPALAPELDGETPAEDPSFSADAAERSFFRRLSEEDKKSRRDVADAEPWLSPLVIRQSRNFRRRFERYYFWLPMAAGIVLCTTFGIVAYRSGIYRGVAVGEVLGAKPALAPASFEPALETARRDRDAANAQVAERNKAIALLEREIARQRSENEELKATASGQQLALRTKSEDQKKLAEERDAAAQAAAADKAGLEAKLENLERQRSEDVTRAASLEAQVAELSRSLQQEESSKAEGEELLAKDRDIRELMGARDLYVAEVHDIAGTGETQKAFGRVFYTKGKSLIFYAYDLKEQRRLEDASFQVWGRRGPDWTQALKLGMFYEDNVSKKRWVLKFNDKKTLDQIDAVFVTVEPHGGSDRPTGKPLLFAYLKVAPNHP